MRINSNPLHYLTDMANLNKVILIGRLTRDAVLNTSRTGNRFCTFGMAVNWRFASADGNQREETEFVDVIVGSRDAERCSTSLHKGSTVYVEGRFRTRTWTDKNNLPRFSVEIIASNIVYLDPSSRSTQATRPDAPPPMDPDYNDAYPQSNVPPPPVAPLNSNAQQDAPASDDSVSPDDVF